MKDIVNFLFEVGILSKTPRSGFHLLGSGNQSVAEHTNRVVFIGYTLGSLEKDVDMLKVLKMCLFHDLLESRISDLNYVHQRYVDVKEEKALEDLAKTLPFGKDIKDIINEYEARQTKEAIIAKDADNIEWILSLKEQADNGNSKALIAIDSAMKRLKTEIGREVANKILETSSESWWFGDKDDEWWVSKNKKTNN